MSGEREGRRQLVMDRRVSLEDPVPWSTSPGLRTTTVLKVPTDSRPNARRGQRVGSGKAFSSTNPVSTSDRRNTSLA
jgi:hypothetical protein